MCQTCCKNNQLCATRVVKTAQMTQHAQNEGLDSSIALDNLVYIHSQVIPVAVSGQENVKLNLCDDSLMKNIIAFVIF